MQGENVHCLKFSTARPVYPGPIFSMKAT